ncbi:unnamed protein product [Acanthoscelides obtectus]|uniref:Peptidase C1A papain C-terminal domain-containing protein n=1 Tax=Acanthoscelides obtectus TaxID=200917 RepID=A0A9P0L3G6_ACAOB|nr:unnamed protein product [Acanthoscelides obtectus]CAK1635182.1 hypothetical protein AOBTE_LOCUS9118 [Acanthoscelides obtectus]
MGATTKGGRHRSGFSKCTLNLVLKVEETHTTQLCNIFALDLHIITIELQVGAIEGQIFLKNGILEPLSAQNLIDCARGKYHNEGCYGGSMKSAFNYTRDHGVLTDQEYPYVSYSGKEGKCKKQGGVKISGYKVTPEGDEQALAKAVALIGPVSVGLDATHMQFYSGGVITKKSGCKNELDDLDHGVLVVAYSEDYWLIKNSWGTTWGEQGYLRLKRNDGNTCGVASIVSYPTLD